MSQQNYQPYEKAQLERQFDQQEFVSVVTHLAKTLSISNVLEVSMIYTEIKHQRGKVLGKDILKLVHLLKEESTVEKQLDAEIQFYKNSILDLSKKGKQILNIGQFFVNFALNNPCKGIVTQQIQEKLSEHKLVSLNKLMGLIETIERSRREHRFDSPRKAQLSKQCDYQSYQTNLYNTNDMSELEILRNIIMEYIPEQKIVQLSICLLDKVKQYLAESTDHLQRIEQLHRYLQINQRKVDQEFLRYEQVINQKDYIISKQCQENEKFEEEVQAFEKKCRQQFLESIQKLALQNSKLRDEKQEIINAYQRLKYQNEVESRDIPAQGKNFELKTSPSISNDDDKMGIQSKLEKNKNYFENVFADELKQAYEKLNAVRLQNLELKNRISDLQLQLQVKPAITSGHQTDRTFKNLVLEEKLSILPYEPKDRLIHNQSEDTKETFLQLLRKRSMYGEIGEHINKSLSFQRTNSIRLIRSVTKQYFNSQVIQQKSFQAENHTEQSGMVTSFSPISSVFHQTKLNLNQFDFLGLLNSKIVQKIVIQNSSMKDIDGNQNASGIFSSFITIINERGKEEKAAFVFSLQTILFCSPQSFELKYLMRVDVLKQLVFCMNLRTWVIIRLSKCLEINGKKQDEFLISIQNRCQFLKYLERIMPSIRCKIFFEEETKISIKQGSKNISLLSFPSAKNALQHSINDGQNIFEAKISYSIVFFNKSFKVLLVLSNHGIWVMQSGKNRGFESFEQKHKLKFILPLCEDMQIIDMSQQKRIKIVYSNKRSYVVDLCSYGEAKLLKHKIKKHLQEVRERKIKQKKKYEMNFFRSNRNADHLHNFILSQYIQF